MSRLPQPCGAPQSSQHRLPVQSIRRHHSDTGLVNPYPEWLSLPIGEDSLRWCSKSIMDATVEQVDARRRPSAATALHLSDSSTKPFCPASSDSSALKMLLQVF
mmetsp:Transcript_26647/g.63507  ORF Transcript_26647/g.63507 Transcript_26647/m.63507 type:complete len:104 (-) Transcript_26647:620-931(-)